MPAFSASCEAVRIHIGDDHVARAGKSRDHRGHDADRAGARDENILAQHGKRKRRVNRISEGIENRGDFARDGARVLPDVHHRQDDVLGERARAVHSHALRVRAQVAPPRETIAAAPADHVPFPADQIAGMKIRHVGSDFDNLSAEFMPDDQRHVNGGARPIVPVVDVQVGAANSRAQHANFDVVDAGFGLGNIFEPQASLGAALNEGFHSGCPPALSVRFGKGTNSRMPAIRAPPASGPRRLEPWPFPACVAVHRQQTWVSGWISPFWIRHRQEGRTRR